jgi:hypothetical protein
MFVNPRPRLPRGAAGRTFIVDQFARPHEQADIDARRCRRDAARLLSDSQRELPDLEPRATALRCAHAQRGSIRDRAGCGGLGLRGAAQCNAREHPIHSAARHSAARHNEERMAAPGQSDSRKVVTSLGPAPVEPPRPRQPVDWLKLGSSSTLNTAQIIASYVCS